MYAAEKGLEFNDANQRLCYAELTSGAERCPSPTTGVAVTRPHTDSMGHGASTARVGADSVGGGDIVADLRKQLKYKDAELDQVLRDMVDRDAEIAKLKAEVHKLQSVLAATVHRDGRPDILTTIHEGTAKSGLGRSKKQGVSGESTGATNTLPTAELQHYHKDFR